MKPDIFGGRKPSEILEGNNPIQDMFSMHHQILQGNRVSGFGSRGRNTNFNRGGRI